jgi:hypothetical protein
MDLAKAAFLFGEVPEWADVDDPEDRAQLLAQQPGHRDELVPVRFFHELLADQITSDDPPEVWQSAQRLLESGIDRAEAMRNLVLALTSQMQISREEQRPFDGDAYVAALARLPLPKPDTFADALVEVVRERQPLSIDDAETEAMTRLGLLPDIEPHRSLLDRVSDHLTDIDGPLTYLAGDRVVHPESMCTGLVLTHRLSELEQEIDCLAVEVDLVGFARLGDVIYTVDGVELHVWSAEPGHVAWRGPDGWLRRFAADDVLAVRVDADVVRMEVLAGIPPEDGDLVRRVRAVYDTEVEEPWMPVSAEEILLGLLADDRDLFAVPRAPLGELCEAAGLEQNGAWFAHEDSVWEQRRIVQRMHSVMGRLDDEADYKAVLAALERFDDADEDPARLRQVLDDLSSARLLAVATDELFGYDDEPDVVDDVASFARRLLGAAVTPRQVVVARWLSAVAEERRGDPLAGQAHLEIAVDADGDWAPALDRLAWYLSDRGDAPGAAGLWRRLGVGPQDNADMREVAGFSGSGSTASKLGRNDPCSCGSGRKYKHCHLDQYELPPLPERVGWLCRKATAYLERRGGQAASDVWSIAEARAGEDPDDEALGRAFDDPLVIDVALLELGWFRQFVAERAALLPDDEALLATSWLMVARTLYEVESVRPGIGLVVRDLRSAELIEVREQTFSRRATEGMVICGRAVPDGETHQFIGGLFPVAPGTETALFDLLDEEDPYALVAYVAALERPPVLNTREGEPLVSYTATLRVVEADSELTRQVLEHHFHHEPDDTWVELHEIAKDDHIVRATLHLDGDRLTVETMSEPRFERVVELLRKELGPVQVLSEKRKSLHVPPDVATLGSPRVPPPGDAAMPLVAGQWRDRQEERWCDESVPALAGLTPRQAAADPTRRETLERLLDSFAPLAAGPEFLGMRPDRLRQLLGIEPRRP